MKSLLTQYDNCSFACSIVCSYYVMMLLRNIITSLVLDTRRSMIENKCEIPLDVLDQLRYSQLNDSSAGRKSFVGAKRQGSTYYKEQMQTQASYLSARSVGRTFRLLLDAIKLVSSGQSVVVYCLDVGPANALWKRAHRLLESQGLLDLMQPTPVTFSQASQSFKFPNGATLIFASAMPRLDDQRTRGYRDYFPFYDLD